MSKERQLPTPFAELGPYAAAYNSLVEQAAIEAGGGASSAQVIPQAEQSRVRRAASAVLYTGLAGAAAVAYGFEIGPWNEALRIDKGLDVLQSTHNALAVGGTVAALTVAIEIVPGTLVALALNSETKPMQRFNSRIKAKNDARIEQEATDLAAKLAEIENRTPNRIDRISQQVGAITEPIGAFAKKGADIGIAFAGGSAMLVAKRHYSDADIGPSKGVRNAAVGTAWIAALSGTVGWLVAGGINAVSNVEMLQKPAEWIVEYGSSKTFWMKLLAAGYTVAIGNKLYKKMRTKTDVQQPVPMAEVANEV